MEDNRYQILNPESHADLSVKPGHSNDLGDNVMECMVFPSEFRNVQSAYPILFQKNPQTGAFYSLALLGFSQGENLYLTDSGWSDVYIPLMMRRQPFLIAFQQSGDNDKRAVVSIDTQSPRLNRDGEGEALFLAHGGASDYLANMSSLLESVHQGHQQTERFCKLLEEHALLESFALDVTLNDGEQCQLMGYYAINEEKLQQLPAEALARLQESGALAPLFMAVASQSQFRPLLARKNALL